MVFIKRFYPYIIIAAVVVIAFANTFSFSLLKSWDDDKFVIEIAGYLNFTPSGIWYQLTTTSLGNYVPLVNLSYAVDHSIGGLNGFMYHFQNVLWHIAACFGLFGCIRLLGVSMVPSLFMTLLYAVHPQRSESVAWIAERRDVMSGAFAFWSAFCYLKFHDRQVFSVSAFALFLCACFSKPAVVTLPVVFAMYEIWKTRSFLPFSKYFRLIPYFVLSIFVSLGTSILQLNPPSQDSMLMKLLKILYNYSWYFLKNFCPGEMAPAYPKIVLGTAVFIKVSIFYLAVLILFLFLFFRFRRLLFFCLIPFAFAYAVSLLPTIGIVPIGIGIWDYADRYSYIPSAILALGGAVLLDSLSIRFMQWKNFFKLEVIVLSLTVFLFAWITFFYNYTWQSYRKILDITVAYDPPNSHFLCMYALSSVLNGKNDEAEKCTDYLMTFSDKNSFDCRGKSIYYTALVLKAMILAERGEVESAFPLFNESFEHMESIEFQEHGAYSVILETAAGCYLKLGKSKMALKCYEAIVINCDDGTVPAGRLHFYKGLVFYIKGNLKMAESEFSEASRLLPGDKNIKANLDEVSRRLKENKQ